MSAGWPLTSCLNLNAGWNHMHEPSHLAWLLVSSRATSLACALTCHDETQLRVISPEAETAHPPHLGLPDLGTQ